MTIRQADRSIIERRNRLHLHKDATGFRCIHCRQYVSTIRSLSGVANRNHCPYCLHSRHLDWQRAGDRLAACKGSMLPVGLAFKQITKRYGTAHGELMIVHRCTECGKLSINRIAADDDAETILAICQHSQPLDLRLRAELKAAGIKTITIAELNQVLGQLFGKN